MKKRLFTLLLAVIMCVSMLSALDVSAFAEESVPTYKATGTVGSYANWVVNERMGYSVENVWGVEGSIPDGMWYDIGNWGQLIVGGTPKKAGTFNATFVLEVFDGSSRWSTSLKTKIKIKGKEPVDERPVITKHPTSEWVTEGGRCSFIARADNIYDITWRIVSADTTVTYKATEAPSYFKGLKVSGQGTEQLFLSNIPLSMNGWAVEARFTGVGGTVFSNGAIIHVDKKVLATPVIKKQPADASLKPGESCTLSIKVTQPDDGNLKYQWYRTTDGQLSGGEAVSGATGSEITVNYKGGPSMYYCAVYAVSGSSQSTTVYSNVATVTGIAPSAEIINGGARISLSRISDHVFSLGTYTTLDYELAEEFGKHSFDGWGGLCSTAVKNVNGTVLVGRNMDMFISNKPAYISYTKVPGCYETIGLTYTSHIGPDYHDIRAGGINEELYKILPFMASDVINSKGLYIETNMSKDENNADGTSKFGCSSTNPGAETRICGIMLPRYVAEHCATVDEALRYIASIDIYTMEGTVPASLSFMIADANGHFGVLELAANKIYWIDGQSVLTNFFLSSTLSAKQEMKSGVGRYRLLSEGIGKVSDADSMYSLMDKVAYSHIYTDNCPYDARSEYVGVRPGWDYRYLTNEANRAELDTVIKQINSGYSGLSRQGLMDANRYWESSFTVVANCSEKTLFVRFFEDDANTVILSFK